MSQESSSHSLFPEIIRIIVATNEGRGGMIPDLTIHMKSAVIYIEGIVKIQNTNPLDF